MYKLKDPVLIKGEKKEIFTEKKGYAHVNYYDWNKDGKKDLLLGEFCYGQCGFKVYENIGTNEKPRFSGEWYYGKKANGKNLEIYNW